MDLIFADAKMITALLDRSTQYNFQIVDEARQRTSQRQVSTFNEGFPTRRWQLIRRGKEKLFASGRVGRWSGSRVTSGFSMTGNETAGVASAASKWLCPDEARAQLKSKLDRFLAAHVGATVAEGAIPSLGLKVSAGLGKTQAALRAIAEFGSDYLEFGHILFYVPTHALAEEAASDFREICSNEKPLSMVPSMVLYGRSAIKPGTRKPLCKRHELAAKLAGKVSSVTQALCKTETMGAESEAECAKDCPYLAQLEVAQNLVIFLPHSYLAIQLPINGPVALRIVDEKFWSSLISNDNIELGNWLAPRWLDAHSNERQQAQNKVSRQARQLICECLIGNRPIHEELRANGIGTEKLRILADTERTYQNDPQIRPSMKDWEINQKIEAMEKSWNFEASRHAEVFDLLAETAHRSTTERLSLVQKDKTRGIGVHTLKQ